MTKLEKKLKELGYKQNLLMSYLYYKDMNICMIYADLNKDRTQCELQLDSIEPINNKEELNSLFKAYNTMQKDLEELKKMKKNNFLKLLLIPALLLVGCDVSTESKEAKETICKLHIISDNKCIECINISIYNGNINAKIKDYGSLYLPSGTCFLVYNKCPICDEVLENER